MPPIIQTAYTVRALPTAAIISRGTRKIPEPMMIPTTIAVALVVVRTRGSSCAATGSCVAGLIAGRLSEPELHESAVRSKSAHLPSRLAKRDGGCEGCRWSCDARKASPTDCRHVAPLELIETSVQL